MKPRRDFLPWIAVSVLILFALGNDVAILGRTVVKLSSGSSGENEVSRFEKRLHALRSVLPRTEVVGYVDDFATELESRRSSTLAGYVLSPVLVERGTGRSLVVGVFRDPVASTGVLRGKGLSPIKDFGQGVVLFERDAK